MVMFSDGLLFENGPPDMLLGYNLLLFYRPRLL